MGSADTSNTLLIILGFVGLLVAAAVSVGIREIEKNWPKHRCNPGVMLTAGVLFGYDTQENFMYCIQNTQSGYMKYLMVPFNYMFTLVGNVANQLVKNIQSIRQFINRLKEKISMRDMMNKLVGIFVTVLHLMVGCMWTIKSMWDGIAGTLVRSLGTA